MYEELEPFDPAPGLYVRALDWAADGEDWEAAQERTLNLLKSWSNR